MNDEKIHYCAFCGKSQHEVQRIVTGPPPASICDECIDLCIDICIEHQDKLPTLQKVFANNSGDPTEPALNPIFKRVKLPTKDRHCFYLGPFSDPFNQIYADHIVGIVCSMGHTISRADQIFGTQPIIEDIWEQIYSCEYVLADVTGRNPNVMYEIGMAHTIGRPVLIMTQSIEDVPFDLKHMRCIVYSFTPRGVKELEEKLTGTIRFLSRQGKTSRGA